MTPFERALSAGGNLVAAWDLEDRARERLVLYLVSEAGARHQAESQVPLATHEDTVDALVARGVRIGAMYAGADFVWVADEAGYAAWTSDARSAYSSTRSSGVVRAHVWLDPADRGHRGVRLDLVSGELPVAEERRASAELLTYGEDDLDLETFWAHYMSEHLALWHEVPVQNDISPYSNDRTLAVRRSALELATALESKASAAVSLPPLFPSLEIELRGSVDGASHEVEVRVRRGSSGEWLARSTKRGTSATVAAFLRRVTTPATVLNAVTAALEAAPKL